MLIIIGLSCALAILQASVVRTDRIDAQVHDFLDRWQSQSVSCAIVDSRVVIDVQVCVRLLDCVGADSLRLALSVRDATKGFVDMQCESDQHNLTKSTASNSTLSAATASMSAVRSIDHLLVPPHMPSSPSPNWRNNDSYVQYDLYSLLAIPQLHLLDTRAELNATAFANSIASNTVNVARWSVVALLICWILCCFSFTLWICFARNSKRAQQERYRARIDTMMEDVWGDLVDDRKQDFYSSEDRALTTLEQRYEDAETRVAELLFQSARGVAVAEPSADGIRQMITVGRADLRATDFRGQTPLQIAIHRGHFPLAKLLIEHGAPTRRAMHWVVDRSSYKRYLAREWIPFLAKHGARLDITNDKGQAVIFAALDRKATTWPHSSLIRELASLGVFDFETKAMARANGGTRLSTICEVVARRLFHLRFDAQNTLLAKNITDVACVVLSICEASRDARVLLDQVPWHRLQLAFQAAEFHNLNSKHITVVQIRWGYVRRRMLAICMALQPLQISALELVAVCDNAVRFTEYFSFHLKWNVVTTVKHFHPDREEAPARATTSHQASGRRAATKRSEKRNRRRKH